MLIHQLYQKTQRENHNPARTSARHQKILVVAEKGWTETQHRGINHGSTTVMELSKKSGGK